MNLTESVDQFGLPLQESKNFAEEAHNLLEKAKALARKSLHELKSLQLEHGSNDRITSEIKAAIESCMDVEHRILHAIHKTESMRQSIQKSSVTEDSKKKIQESIVEVPFKKNNKNFIAQFEVTGKMQLNDRGEPEWVGDYDIRSVGVKDSKGKEIDVEIQPWELERIEDKALAKFADEQLGK